MKTYPLLIKDYAVKMYWGSGSKTPHILNLYTRLRWLELHVPAALASGKELPLTITTFLLLLLLLLLLLKHDVKVLPETLFHISKTKLSLCLIKYHAMKTYWGVEIQLHTFFDLGTRWRWVVSFTPQPLYPQGKSPWYPLDRRLGGR